MGDFLETFKSLDASEALAQTAGARPSGLQMGDNSIRFLI